MTCPLWMGENGFDRRQRLLLDLYEPPRMELLKSLGLKAKETKKTYTIY